MRPLIVLNVVGLTPALLGTSTPHLSALAARSSVHTVVPVLPAVTCSAQSSMLTGLPPSGHGIVGNGWYFRELGEILFWRQSNRLVQGENVWDAGKRRDPGFTCANLFWWYAMNTTADVSVTPRPIYLADGRKLPDCYTIPGALAGELTRRFGTFPLFKFWGPATTIEGSRWIAQAAIHVRKHFKPTLLLTYLPHLDYDLQRIGPGHPKIARTLLEIDAVCGEIIADADRDGTRVLVVSEYGITPVSRPVHVNRVLREAGLLAVRDERGREQLDPAASDAFAVADHQIAHIYVRDPARIPQVSALLRGQPGIEVVLDGEGQKKAAVDHARGGDLLAVAAVDAWFTWYHWLDDARAPDFARTVEIHRKAGYDPVELFLDPRIRFPTLAVGWRLAKRALGFRSLLDVIPLDASLVKGSHGRLPAGPAEGPVLIGADPALLPGSEGGIPMTAMKQIMLNHIFGRPT